MRKVYSMATPEERKGDPFNAAGEKTSHLLDFQRGKVKKRTRQTPREHVRGKKR